MSEAALDLVTIERAEAVAGETPFLIALSGGGDSVALLRLMHAHFGAARLRALVVDHALRQGSADDAKRAASFAEALGVRAEISTLSWAGRAKPGQGDARDARYAALCAAARAHGARAIVTGHTRDDQAETVLLRAARGSTWRGLAGMRALAPAPIWPEGRELWLARPLLAARRAALRETLRAQGAPWIEDPANDNADFARVRARQRLAALAATGFDPMRLAELADDLAPRAAALDAAARALIADAVAFDQDRAILRPDAWCAGDTVRQRALSVVLTAVAGAPREPDADRVAALEGRLRSDAFTAATLGGAALRRRDEAIVLSRDPGALTGRADGAPPLPPLVLPPGVDTIWDGRVALRVAEPGWSVVIENGTPVLARAGQCRPLVDAAPNWLLAARVAHVLGSD